MKQPVLFLSVLLVLWITGASYWYVCKIRCDCKKAVAPSVEKKLETIIRTRIRIIEPKKENENHPNLIKDV